MLQSLDAASEAASSSSSEDILDLEADEGWEDAEPDVEQEQFVSLFDEKVFSDIQSMLRYCKNQYDFDFLATRQALGLDFYGNIKLVNYIRSCVQEGEKVVSNISRKDLDNDNYLKPVLENDALLFSLDELPPVEMDHDKAGRSSGELLARVSELEEELRKTQAQFTSYRETVKETLDERWNSGSGGPSKPEAASAKNEKRDDDSHYFTSYSYNDIHETMLKDSVRTDAYRDFIYNHKHLFAGKTVLDIGCGTGVLSMFCARAGAAHVIAVDNSAIIDKARSIVFTNSLSPPITLLRGRVEEVTLPAEKVDIIISEWMGYALLYEAMLDSVIWARDKYLKEDGLMVPSHMNLWTAPIEDNDYVAEHISWWRDVYGFDMGAMQEDIHKDAQVLDMPQSTLCSDSFPFLQLDLYKTGVLDLSFKRDWKVTLNKDIDSLDGFMVWFDTFFMPGRSDSVPANASAAEWSKKGENGVAFTTGTFGKVTHWKQAVFLVDNIKTKPLPRKAGTSISGFIEYSVPEDNSRALNIGMQWKTEAGAHEESERTQTWEMR